MDHNRDIFDGMVLFCAVVDHASFSAAAKLLGHTPSHVSKEIQRLETRLGARLLNRTTRRISLTEAGQIYYDNASRLVQDAGAVQDRLHSLGDRPFGELRMTVPVIFAQSCLHHWLPEFLVRYPEVSLQIDVSERRADLVGEAIDLAVRIGSLPSSDLIARELFRTPGVMVASPAYLDRHGVPNRPEDLIPHQLIDFSFHQTSSHWEFHLPDGGTTRVPVSPRVRCNAAETEKMLALLGAGITRLPELACRAELASGQLVRLLQDYQRPASGVHVIYPSKDNLPSKTRAMIDFLIEKSRAF